MRAPRVLAVVMLIAACDHQQPAPTSPPAPTPAVVSLSISGLPAPMLPDIPPSVAARRSYPLKVVATRTDGSTADLTAEELAWVSSDPAVVSVSGVTLGAHGDGSATVTAMLLGTTVTASQMVSAYTSGIARAERAERVDCSATSQPVCSYPACPRGGPFWLFPVHETGTIELVSVRNPGWGSPSNYVVQLSPEGKYVRSWLLLPTNPQFKTATVPGGYMYAFTMSADLGPCGDVSAVWTHPK